MIYVYRDGKIVPKTGEYVGVTRGPYVISDTMEPTEQVNGRFYTSKAEFRAVGRSLGLIEVGNEKLPPITRSTDRREVKEARQRDIKNAVDKFRARHGA